MALTDARLRTLKPEKGKTECLVADGNGLYIRVRAARDAFSRTWQFRRRENRRPSITKLGIYPDLSIKEARLKAAELATKRKAHSPTVEQVATQWLAERVDHTHRKADQVHGYVDRAIIPELGPRRVRDIALRHCHCDPVVPGPRGPSCLEAAQAAGQRRGHSSRCSKAYSAMPLQTAGLHSLRPLN